MSNPHADHEQSKPLPGERITSPMQPYSTGQVGIGFVVLVVGLVVTFGVPLML